MGKREFLKNIFILGFSGIVAKLFDFCFKAYYSRVLGSEGMGLLSLGFSLHGVMLTFATAGLGVAVSKTTSEFMEFKRHAAVKCCMRSALFGVTSLSLLVTLGVLIFSPYLAKYVLGDERVALSLCTLAPSVIFMGISYCLKGWFYAQRKTLPPASSEILEQIIKFAFIKFFLWIFIPYGTEYACAAVFAGISVGELSSCAYLFFFYMRYERYTYNPECIRETSINKKNIICTLLGISIPSMITSLCSSGLRMKEDVLIVSAFERGGFTHSSALEVLGMIQGMALPMLILPLNLAGSVMSLLIPEISRAGAVGGEKLKNTTMRVYRCGAFVGTVVCIVFLIWGDRMCYAFFGSRDAADTVVRLAPLCPIMFIDSLSCSILNGIGKQTKLLVFSLMDFALRYSLIYFAIPDGKTEALILMTVLSNVFTCTLTLGSVLKTVKPRLCLKSFKKSRCRMCK